MKVTCEFMQLLSFKCFLYVCLTLITDLQFDNMHDIENAYALDSVNNTHIKKSIKKISKHIKKTFVYI